MKLEFPDLEKKVLNHIQKFEPEVVVFERSHIGTALQSTFENSPLSKLMHDGPVSFTGISPKNGKIERAAVQSVKIEQGRVFLPVKASWLADFENEVRQFPNGRYDDQVDSMVQFLMAMDYLIVGFNC